MNHNQEREGKKPLVIGNLLATIMFLSIGVVSIISGDWVDSSIWFSLGGALFILGSESTPWAEIPLWRRAGGILLVIVGLVLFVIQIMIDFQS